MSTNCSSTCGTRDHATFGECLRAKNLRLSHDGKIDHIDAQRKWDKELDSYRSAVSQGMEPESTRTKDIKAAVRWSEKNGVAYSSETKHGVDLNAALTKVA
jgi:cob(I)alamin adenosyltransferase